MADINTGLSRTRRLGGLLELTDVESTTTYDDALGLEAGTLEFTEGLYDALIDSEHGELVTSIRRGDAQPSTVRATFKVRGFASGSLYALLQDQVKGTDDGLLRQWTVVHKQGDFEGDTAGEQLTFSNCVVTSLSFREGADYDTFSVEWTCPHPSPTLGTYGA